MPRSRKQLLVGIAQVLNRLVMVVEPSLDLGKLGVHRREARDHARVHGRQEAHDPLQGHLLLARLSHSAGGESGRAATKQDRSRGRRAVSQVERVGLVDVGHDWLGWRREGQDTFRIREVVQEVSAQSGKRDVSEEPRRLLVQVDLLNDIEKTLHPHQFGGLKGSSPEHYLGGLLQDAANMKEKKLTPVLLMWDFSSAFNCLLHEQVIASAAALGVRQPLLRLLASYLSERKTVVKWQETRSSSRPCRGGSGQGTLLSVILFVIAVDHLLKTLQAEIDSAEGHIRHEGVSVPRLFVDDTAVLIGIDSSKLPTDLNGNKLWSDVDGRVGRYCRVLEEFSSSTGMLLNQGKTTALVMDSSIKFPLERYVEQGKTKFRQVLESARGHSITKTPTAKLLGVVLEEGMKFHDFVSKKTKSANKALWGLRRIRGHSVSQKHLRSAYISYVRSTLEYGIPAVWKSLTQGDIDDLEQVQKRATKIILNSGWTPLSKGYIEYEDRLKMLQLTKLEERWNAAFTDFAKKLEFDHRFARYIQPRLTRDVRDRQPYFVQRMGTDQRRNSPLRQAVIVLNSLESTVDERRAEWHRRRRRQRS